MDIRSARLAALVAVLALSSSKAVFGQATPSTSEAAEVEAGFEYISLEPFPHALDTCSTALFPGPSLPARPSYPIDFCKELVIVDPEIIRSLPDLSFGNMMHLLLDTSAQDTRGIMRSWADTWKDVGDNLDRVDISQRIFNAWNDDRIRLIAIVNRLDLALASEGEEDLGEGRLVYQMVDDQPGAGFLPMTFILEFAYPKLDPGGNKMENLVLWAEKWHKLGTLPTSAAAFRVRLRAIVGEFALSRQLRRIRTNEALGGSDWAFREHSFSSCEGSKTPAPCSPELKWASLRDTPLDAVREDYSDLLTYLENKDVQDALKRGDHDFNNDYDPASDLHFDLDWLAETGEGPTWVSPRRAENQSLLLVAFNTCNGCHADFKSSHDVFPHIGIQPGEDSPSLSTFLTKDIFLKFELAGCQRAAWFGCGENGPADAKYRWNEQKHRVYYLYSKLRANQEQARPFIEPLLHYRYH